MNVQKRMPIDEGRTLNSQVSAERPQYSKDWLPLSDANRNQIHSFSYFVLFPVIAFGLQLETVSPDLKKLKYIQLLLLLLCIKCFFGAYGMV